MVLVVHAHLVPTCIVVVEFSAAGSASVMDARQRGRGAVHAGDHPRVDTR